MKSKEAVERANRLRPQLALDRHPAFSREFGEWRGSPAGYYLYLCQGQEVKLRYNQATCLWTAIAEDLNIETRFRHQTPEIIKDQLDVLLSAQGGGEGNELKSNIHRVAKFGL